MEPCGTTCLTLANRCGDGVVDSGELCDDGNRTSGDGCRADCLGVEACGDGWADATEACDDGNLVRHDGCSPECVADTCLDGIAQPQELCFWPEGLQPTSASLLDLAAADVDGDGAAEVILLARGRAAVEGPGRGGRVLEIWGRDGAGGWTGPSRIGAPAGSQHLRTGDFDGDGATDLAVASRDVLGLSLGDGSGGFGPFELLDVSSLEAIDSADFNRDGRDDLLLVKSESPVAQILFSWGEGRYEALAAISPPEEDAIGIAGAVGDLDGDGWSDVALVLEADGVPQTRSYRNVGNGLMAPQATWGTCGHTNVHAADVDGDGRDDLLAGGSGVCGLEIGFSRGSEIAVADRIRPGDSVVVGNSIAVVDFEGDGDLDIVAGDHERLHAFTQLDDGSFAASRQIPLPGAVLLAAADFNGDGRQEVAAASGQWEMTLRPWTMGVRVLGEPEGDPLAMPPRRLTAGGGSLDVLADVDGDGDLDAVKSAFDESSDTLRDRLFWLESPGVGTYAEPVTLGELSHLLSVTATDFDGDGDLDLMVAESGPLPGVRTVHFWPFEGGAFGSPSELMGVEASRPLFGDFDGNGETDVAGIELGDLVIWRQLSGAFQKNLLIGERTDRFAAAVDVNGDGTVDVVAGGAAAKWVGWDDASQAFEEHIVLGSSGEIAAGDLDGESGPDLLVLDEAAGLQALLNDGTGTFAARPPVPVPSHGTPVLGDLDGDGDVDVAWQGHVSRNDGSGTFSAPTGLPVAFGRPQFVADIDGDGQPEIVTDFAIILHRMD